MRQVRCRIRGRDAKWQFAFEAPLRTRPEGYCGAAGRATLPVIRAGFGGRRNSPDWKVPFGQHTVAPRFDGRFRFLLLNPPRFVLGRGAPFVGPVIYISIGVSSGKKIL